MPLPESACPLPGSDPEWLADPQEAQSWAEDYEPENVFDAYLTALPGTVQTITHHGADFDKILTGKPTTGFWLKLQPEKISGYVDQPVKVAFANPYHTSSAALLEEAQNLHPPPGGWPNGVAKAKAVRDHLLDMGFDGVILHDNQYDEEQITGVVVVKRLGYKLVVPKKVPAPPPLHVVPHAAPAGPAPQYDYLPPPAVPKVGTLVKTPAGTGQIVETKGNAWIKVQGVKPAWHKTETVQVAVPKPVEPPKPEWAPAVKGQLKVGDYVKTDKGPAVVTGFQGQAWASVEPTIAGGPKIAKWQKVSDLQVQVAAKAPAVPPPTATPQHVAQVAQQNSAAQAQQVGPSGHGLVPGETKVHWSVSGKTGTVYSVSAAGFTILYEDGTFGAGNWVELGAGTIQKGAKPLTQPVAPPPHVPGQLEHGTKVELPSGKVATVIKVDEQGYVTTADAKGNTTIVKQSSVKVVGPPESAVAAPKLKVGDEVFGSAHGTTGVFSVAAVHADGTVDLLNEYNEQVPHQHPVAFVKIKPEGTVATVGDTVVTLAGQKGVVTSLVDKTYAVKLDDGKESLYTAPQLQVVDHSVGTAAQAPAAPPKMGWIPATVGKVKVGDKVITPYGPGEISEMQGKAWAAIKGAKPKWQKVENLKVQGLVDPNAPEPEAGGYFTAGKSTPSGPGQSYQAGQIDPGSKTYRSVENDAAWAAGWASRLKTQITASERQAVTAYTGSSYSGWNAQLRRSKGQAGAYASKIRELDKALWKTGADDNIVAYRGASSTGIHDWTQMIGSYYTDHAYQSTSVRASSSFGGDVKFTIRIPKGTPGAYVSAISNFSSEREFLLARGTRLRIVGAKKTGYTWEVTAEVDLDPNMPKP